MKGYRLWDPSLHNIVITRDVMFDEYSLLKTDVEKVEQEHVSSNQQIQRDTQPFL